MNKRIRVTLIEMCILFAFASLLAVFAYYGVAKPYNKHFSGCEQKCALYNMDVLHYRECQCKEKEKVSIPPPCGFHGDAKICRIPEK